jgi:HSP20 family molecular chaperone IbpA
MAEVRGHTEKPERFDRCFAAADWERGHLRVEEYNDGVDLVLRGVLSDIDPDSDVEIYLGEGVLHIEAHRVNKWQGTRGAYPSAFPFGSFARNIAVAPGVRYHVAADVTAVAGVSPRRRRSVGRGRAPRGRRDREGRSRIAPTTTGLERRAR